MWVEGNTLNTFQQSLLHNIISSISQHCAILLSPTDLITFLLCLSVLWWMELVWWKSYFDCYFQKNVKLDIWMGCALGTTEINDSVAVLVAFGRCLRRSVDVCLLHLRQKLIGEFLVSRSCTVSTLLIGFKYSFEEIYLETYLNTRSILPGSVCEGRYNV